jgi:hypothetical protein
MVVILLLSAVLTNTIKYGSNLYEGLENEDEEEKEENMENQDDDAAAENMENKEEDKETSKDTDIQSQILSNIKKMNEYLQKLTLSPKVEEPKKDEVKK